MQAVRTFEELDAIASVTARRVAKRQRDVSEEDLRQEAWVALLAFAVPNFDPSKGSFKAWAESSAWRPCVWAACKAGRQYTRAEEVQRRVDWPAKPEEGEEAAAERRLWRERVSSAVRDLLQGASEPELLVVMREKTSAELAAELGETAQAVRKRCSALRKRLAGSEELQRLWREERP